jgi:hypothetical protein
MIQNLALFFKKNQTDPKHKKLEQWMIKFFFSMLFYLLN